MKAFVEWCKQTFGAPPIMIEAEVPTIRALLVTIVAMIFGAAGYPLCRGGSDARS
jgi:hypothetical protein